MTTLKSISLFNDDQKSVLNNVGDRIRSGEVGIIFIEASLGPGKNISNQSHIVICQKRK